MALPSSWLNGSHDFLPSIAKEQPFFSCAGNCVLRPNTARSSFRGFCNPVKALKGCCSQARFLLQKSKSSDRSQSQLSSNVKKPPAKLPCVWPQGSGQ